VDICCSFEPPETCDITNFAVCVCDFYFSLTFAADIGGVVSLSAWATARTTEEPYSNSRLGREIYPFCRSFVPPPGPNKPSVQCVLLALFRGLKRTEHELSHPHPCGVLVKNEWSFEPTPPFSFVACTWIILRTVLPN
jgi:hypothetical protein